MFNGKRILSLLLCILILLPSLSVGAFARIIENIFDATTMIETYRMEPSDEVSEYGYRPMVTYDSEGKLVENLANTGGIEGIEGGSVSLLNVRFKDEGG